jgi:hypothetical protein
VAFVAYFGVPVQRRSGCGDAFARDLPVLARYWGPERRLLRCGGKVRTEPSYELSCDNPGEPFVSPRQAPTKRQRSVHSLRIAGEGLGLRRPKASLRRFEPFLLNEPDPRGSKLAELDWAAVTTPLSG